MTNEERKRIMAYIIERQKTFADQMVQYNVRMTQKQAAMTCQQQIEARQQAAIFAMIESQQQASADVSNLARAVNHLAEKVTMKLKRTGNGNNPDANTTR